VAGELQAWPPASRVITGSSLPPPPPLIIHLVLSSRRQEPLPHPTTANSSCLTLLCLSILFLSVCSPIFIYLSSCFKCRLLFSTPSVFQLFSTYLSSCLILSSAPSVHRLFSIFIHDPSVTSLLCFTCPLAILYLFLVSSVISSVFLCLSIFFTVTFSSPFHLSPSYWLFSVCLHDSYFPYSSLFHLSSSYWLFSVCFMLHLSSSLLCPICPPAIGYSLSAS
jgi:hypothetical protein